MKSSNKDEYIVFGRPSIGEEERDAVDSVLRSGWIGTGSKSHEFESLFENRYKGYYALALNSCTAALQLACEVLNLSHDDEVIVPAMTFCATAASVALAGGKIKLADVSPDTKCLTSQTVSNCLTENTKAVIYVHMTGYPSSEIFNIKKICSEKGIVLIEDCAHALETEIEGEKAGTIGDISCFSFYATKNITTAEGGMILSNSHQIINRCKVKALHGMSKDAWQRFSDVGYCHYDVVEIGKKMNMTDISAAIGICQFQKMSFFSKKRKEIFEHYVNEFKNLHSIKLPKEIENKRNIHSYHLFTFEINQVLRDQLLLFLHKNNIGSGVHYRSLTHLTAYSNKSYLSNSSPSVAEKIGNETISIPLMPSLSYSEIERIVKVIKEFIEKN